METFSAAFNMDVLGFSLGGSPPNNRPLDTGIIGISSYISKLILPWI